MRNGRFNTSKCRGKLQNMGVLYTHSPKRPLNFQKNNLEIKIYIKKGHSLTVGGPSPLPASD
jgi:hypothetical protein